MLIDITKCHYIPEAHRPSGYATALPPTADQGDPRTLVWGLYSRNWTLSLSDLTLDIPEWQSCGCGNSCTATQKRAPGNVKGGIHTIKVENVLTK